MGSECFSLGNPLPGPVDVKLFRRSTKTPYELKVLAIRSHRDLSIVGPGESGTTRTPSWVVTGLLGPALPVTGFLLFEGYFGSGCTDVTSFMLFLLSLFRLFFFCVEVTPSFMLLEDTLYSSYFPCNLQVSWFTVLLFFMFLFLFHTYSYGVPGVRLLPSTSLVVGGVLISDERGRGLCCRIYLSQNSFFNGR